METILLSAETRDKKADANKLRQQGILPAVVYGHKTINAVISVNYRDFSDILKQAGSSSLVDLSIDQQPPIKVIIHDIQYHPISDRAIHADFYQVKMDEKITTQIPIRIIGESPAVKEQSGSLITNKSEIEAECLPADLIHDIEVDISRLDDFEKTITVADLKVPEKIMVLDDPEEVVILVQPPRSEEELKALEEEVKEDIEQVEVEEKGKEEGEGTVEGEGETATEEKPADQESTED